MTAHSPPTRIKLSNLIRPLICVSRFRSCKTPFHQNDDGIRWTDGSPLPDWHPYVVRLSALWKHRHELGLLRSIEMECAALREEMRSAKELSSAIVRVDSHKGSYSWSEADLANAQGKLTNRKADPVSAIKAKIDEMEEEGARMRSKLPDYVQKLILGYELRTFYFELIECARKLAIVCLPVFFQPSGSVSQLIFGLVVCFLTFGVNVFYAPYIEDGDDHLAQLCQVQIFFALLSSITLKFDEEHTSRRNQYRCATHWAYLRAARLAVILETPLVSAVVQAPWPCGSALLLESCRA